MASANFNTVPGNATGPPPPPQGSRGAGNNEREPPGGFLGDKKHNNGIGVGGFVDPITSGNGVGGAGSVSSGNIEPDPSEPNYSADVWDYIHYAARNADQDPSRLSSQIRNGNIDAHTSDTRYTPLHVAVKFGQAEGVRKLLAARARVDSPDVLGQTALALSCCYDVGTKIPQQLLDAEASIDHVDRYSWTPLFWAASKGYYNLAQLLVNRGANKNARDKRGRRPCDVAANARIRTLLN